MEVRNRVRSWKDKAKGWKIVLSPSRAPPRVQHCFCFFPRKERWVQKKGESAGGDWEDSNEKSIWESPMPSQLEWSKKGGARVGRLWWLRQWEVKRAVGGLGTVVLWNWNSCLKPACQPDLPATPHFPSTGFFLWLLSIWISVCALCALFHWIPRNIWGQLGILILISNLRKLW